MALAYFRIKNNELLNKDTDVVPEQAHIIILDIKYAIWMANNGKDTKHTRNISRRMYFVKKKAKSEICKRQCSVREVQN